MDTLFMVRQVLRHVLVLSGKTVQIDTSTHRRKKGNEATKPTETTPSTSNRTMASLAQVEHRYQDATVCVGNLDPSCTESLLL
jgi:hypothetical protein